MTNQTHPPPYRELRRSTRNRMFAGVCGGLGEFFGIDPTVIRLLFVFGVIFGWGVMILVYLVLFVVVPEDAQAYPPTTLTPSSQPVPPVPAEPTIETNPEAPAEPPSEPL